MDPFTVGAALIGGASSLFGGNKAEKTSKRAAQIQQQQFAQTRADLAPYRGAGTNALGQYLAALGLSGDDAQADFYNDFQYDPGFETSLDNALDATMRKYAILGNTGGGLASSLLKTGQNALYSQYKDRIGQLGGLIDTGRAASGSTASAGQTAAANAGNFLNQAGQFGAGGIIGLGQAGVNALNNNMTYNWLQQGFGTGRGGAAPGGWDTYTVNRWG